MAARSKKLTRAEPKISQTGVEVESCYCRKCMRIKSAANFYVATDFYLDANGFMSICRDCCNEIYSLFLQNETTMERTLLRICRLLNVKYDERAIEATQVHLQTLIDRGSDGSNVFGIYKAKVMAVSKVNPGERGDTSQNYTFVEPSSEVTQAAREVEVRNSEYYEQNWGKGMTEVDYDYLEQEFSKWKRTTKCDTQSEEILVREICHKQNEIRAAREVGKSVDGQVKSLQELMKNSALTPATQNIANSGRNADTFGNWIKDIENLSPAEWYEDQLKFRDMDGLEEDRENIKRSIGNFITGSRDFNTTDLEDINEGDLDEEV